MSSLKFLVTFTWLAVAAADTSALRGASRSEDKVGRIQLSEGEAEVDFTDPAQLMEFMRTEGLTKAWVPKNKPFKKDPLAFYTEEELSQNPLVFNARDDILFDILDRATNVAYFVGPNDQFSTEPEFFAWYSSKDFAFRQRYFVPGAPGVSKPSYFVSSAGLPEGQFREAVISDVTFKEANRVQFIGTYPDCALQANRPQFTLTLALRNLKIFYSAGSTVTEMTDPFGNVYFLYARRGPNPPPLYGFSVVDRVLEEDKEIQCLSLNGVPKNKDGDESVVCKQLIVNDFVNNAYMLVEKKSDDLPELSSLLSPYGITPCTALPLTEPIFAEE